LEHAVSFDSASAIGQYPHSITLLAAGQFRVMVTFVYIVTFQKEIGAFVLSATLSTTTVPGVPNWKITSS